MKAQELELKVRLRIFVRTFRAAELVYEAERKPHQHPYNHDGVMAAYQKFATTVMQTMIKLGLSHTTILQELHTWARREYGARCVLKGSVQWYTYTKLDNIIIDLPGLRDEWRDMQTKADVARMRKAVAR